MGGGFVLADSPRVAEQKTTLLTISRNIDCLGKPENVLAATKIGAYHWNLYLTFFLEA